MITFGLTGGIASGKSTVTKTFRAHGIPMVDADIVARQVVMPGTKGLKIIIDTFGEEYLLEDGTMNRPMMAELVFKDKEKLKIMDKIMLPLIREESAKQINVFHQCGNPIVGYDAALIVEMGNAKVYNPLIVVHCRLDQQLDRLMRRNGLTEAQAMARINAQTSVAQKLEYADYAVDTSGTIEESITQTEKLIAIMKSLK
jgi:dephospho-CoA kinase